MRVEILRTDGTDEVLDIAFGDIHKHINADLLDTVNLRDGRVMLVDDMGHAKGLPVNYGASYLYHVVCRPGSNPPPIVGDVAIVSEVAA